MIYSDSKHHFKRTRCHGTAASGSSSSWLTCSSSVPAGRLAARRAEEADAELSLSRAVQEQRLAVLHDVGAHLGTGGATSVGHERENRRSATWWRRFCVPPAAWPPPFPPACLPPTPRGRRSPPASAAALARCPPGGRAATDTGAGERNKNTRGSLGLQPSFGSRGFN